LDDLISLNLRLGKGDGLLLTSRDIDPYQSAMGEKERLALGNYRWMVYVGPFFVRKVRLTFELREVIYWDLDKNASLS